GGGIASGSLLLFGGDPGIGKSTLLLQAAMALAAGPESPRARAAEPTGAAPRRVLYVAGEESEEQVRMRAARLGAIPTGLLVLCETDLEAVLAAASDVKPDVIVVDSIQTIARGDLEGGPGTVTQMRECGLALLHFAKATRTAVLLVGHVTKDGLVAGPRVLEHMVDAVLYLEGERYQHYRVLRAAKNRFGATHELGVFEMTDRGLAEVANPSAAFLSPAGDRPSAGARAARAPGTAVVASLEGSRPLLVEVQALVSTSFYGTPQRVTSGFDSKRLAVLLAVLERRVGLRLGRHDVFVSVTGGLSLDEPGTDLGVALAIASSFKSRPLLDHTIAIGEVSLSGELRRVPRLDVRVREAAHLGFTRAGVPGVQADEAAGAGIEVIALGSLREAFEKLLGGRVDPAPSAGGSAGAAGADKAAAAREREATSGSR
ncbi:MAG: DNA repair protein RadA, partial [Candidatus Eisenbacteria bacterium]|nr:DNA repair protein RadA [Candidatus Eisenbacteria bacterium]